MLTRNLDWHHPWRPPFFLRHPRILSNVAGILRFMGLVICSASLFVPRIFHLHRSQAPHPQSNPKPLFLPPTTTMPGRRLPTAGPQRGPLQYPQPNYPFNGPRYGGGSRQGHGTTGGYYDDQSDASEYTDSRYNDSPGASEIYGPSPASLRVAITDLTFHSRPQGHRHRPDGPRPDRKLLHSIIKLSPCPL